MLFSRLKLKHKGCVFEFGNNASIWWAVHCGSVGSAVQWDKV